ncbi:MAG TPA: non-canonical purine NTP pyrophosphatase, RdgB/HAM1 family [Rhodospirillaceae bacterium]|nr:non-canonical purine NTP pyrophosphatase, RdgB/HAM1 family [Rhodospirillaceae bacterium]|tara:strand:+ start:21459 stop:22055 length:597 start_codon:yes stop_codon:yes gene_type:complete
MLDDLVIATHNAGKAREISELLRPYVRHFHTAGELNLPEPEETGDSFAANAKLKAVAAAQASGKVALADDSGLAVEALDGAPGIYSARWGGPEKDFNLAMEKVNDALSTAKSESRKAAFVCALALASPDGECHIFEGHCTGDITWPPRGDKGFGYDPIFQPDGHAISFAEMDANDKQAISHRAKAFALLVEGVFNKAA